MLATLHNLLKLFTFGHKSSIIRSASLIEFHKNNFEWKGARRWIFFKLVVTQKQYDGGLENADWKEKA